VWLVFISIYVVVISGFYGGCANWLLVGCCSIRAHNQSVMPTLLARHTSTLAI